MPAPTEAGVRREGEALRFSGALVRDAVPALWRSARALAGGAQGIDIPAVGRIDSAGLAMLSALAGQAAGGLAVTGNPPGLADLRAAYRLDAVLGFAS